VAYHQAECVVDGVLRFRSGFEIREESLAVPLALEIGLSLNASGCDVVKGPLGR
jgi:hypothetical protein